MWKNTNIYRNFKQDLTEKTNSRFYCLNDYKRCSCGAVAIDGGKDYLKRILAPYFAKDKLAIITNKDYTEIKKAISKYYLFK